MKRHAGTHARAWWIGTRAGLEVDELRPGYVLVRARVRGCAEEALHQKWLKWLKFLFRCESDGGLPRLLIGLSGN